MEQILRPSDLRSQRQSCGVSQAQLARDVGIQRSYISQFENGRYVFDDIDLLSIKSYLDSTVNSKFCSMVNQKDTVAENELLVPGVFDEEEVDTGQTDLHSYIESFQSLCAEEIPKWLFFVNEEELQAKHLEAGLIAIQALNYILEHRGLELFESERGGDIGESLLEIIDGTI